MQNSSAFSENHHQFNEALYNKTLSDPRVSLETIYTSSIGIGITVTTASLSTLASILIIFIICRSITKTGSVYHRIMFGMSFYDIIQSLAMSFTTMPMPTDMIYEQFEGLIIGTQSSCRAQGFLFVCGSLSSLTYNVVLCWYYLCALHFQMTEDDIRKYVEPFFHILPFVVSLALSWLSLNYDLIHPSPYISFCMPMPYPYWCTDESDCLNREDYGSERSWILLRASSVVLGIMYSSAIISLVVVVLSVYKRERRFRRSANEVTTEEDAMNSWLIQEYRNDLVITKNAMKQSLYYIAALIAVYFVPIIRTMETVINEESFIIETSPVSQILHFLLRPSQGVFNLLIFVQAKVLLLRRERENACMPTSHLLIAVILNGEEAEVTPISSLELVRRKEAINNLQDAPEIEGGNISLPSDVKSNIESQQFSRDSDDGAPSTNRDGLSGFSDSVMSDMEGVSLDTTIP